MQSHTHRFSSNALLWRLLIRKFELLDRPEISLRFAKLMESMGCEPRDVRSYNSVLSLLSFLDSTAYKTKKQPNNTSYWGFTQKMNAWTRWYHWW